MRPCGARSADVPARAAPPTADPTPTNAPLDLPDADVVYDPAFLAPGEADALLAALLDEVTWEQHHVRIAGKCIPSPRLSAWHGDPGVAYRYSGTTYRADGWTPTLAALRDRLLERTGHRFDSVLVNRYRDGADSMGWHADDELELGPEPVIASISLGAARRFALKHKRRKDVDPVRLELAHGSLLLMSGATQAHWRHAVPKTARPVGERVNLTFRRIVAPA